MSLRFEVIDEMMMEKNVPLEISKIIYGYYKEVQCRKCLKDCSSCSFCEEHKLSDYFCPCCCCCESVCGNLWETHFKMHTGIKIEKEKKPSFRRLMSNPSTPPSPESELDLEDPMTDEELRRMVRNTLRRI